MTSICTSVQVHMGSMVLAGPLRQARLVADDYLGVLCKADSGLQSQMGHHIVH